MQRICVGPAVFGWEFRLQSQEQHLCIDNIELAVVVSVSIAVKADTCSIW